MEYSSLWFLYGLLPLILAAYFLLPDINRKNTLLIVSSVLLLALCQPLSVPVLLAMARFNFIMGRKIRKGKKGTILLPVAVNLAVLFILKYLDPVLLLAGIGTQSDGILLGFAAKLVDALNKLGLALEYPSALVPLGYSFFTLISLSYLIDIYRGKHPAERSFQAFLLYILFLPRLFQGPLQRYEQMGPQLKQRRESFRQVFDGMVRFCTGLGKKVLLADYCGRMIGELASVKSDQALVGSWLTAVLFLLQVYYDFSGCCDMAVGLGRIFGFRMPENFNLPYTALSVTDFFSRWNLTLGCFLRDYVEEPLKRRRAGKLNGFLALMVSFLCMGLWHGGTLNFAIWGVYFGLLIWLEWQFPEFLEDLPDWLRRILTMLAVLLGWVVFMHPDVEALGTALKALIGEGGSHVRGDGARVMNCIPLIAVCWLGATSLPKQVRLRWRYACGVAGKKEEEQQSPVGAYVYAASCMVYVLLILWWCTVSRTGTASVPSVFLNL